MFIYIDIYIRRLLSVCLLAGMHSDTVADIETKPSQGGGNLPGVGHRPIGGVGGVKGGFRGAVWGPWHYTKCSKEAR